MLCGGGIAPARGSLILEGAFIQFLDFYGALDKDIDLVPYHQFGKPLAINFGNLRS